jgi:hypothetical protein
MTAEGALPFPGSRTLASWGRQLAAWQPEALWVGHILLHRVEALVRGTVAVRLDPLPLLVLKSLTVTPGKSLPALQAQLHLDRQLLGRLLQSLHSAGLARSESGWTSTDRGLQAVAEGRYARLTDQRQAFYFVQSERSARPPHFLPLAEPPTRPWPAGSDWRFDVSVLSACLAQPMEWKKRFGFPVDVEGTVGNEAGVQGAEAWRGVIIDRPERLVAVLALGQDGNRLLGFAVQEKGWVLASESPLFTLDHGWREVFPDLTVEVPLQDWTDAWQGWAQAHGCAKREAEGVQITPEGHRLQATGARELVERLRNEAARGETWLLAGQGRLRAAAVLEFPERVGHASPQP